jgi:predicted dithiol-disulfide oxidoreductase (DUF899 family)
MQHQIATREQWLASRLELLKAEKEHTRQGDELARRRQELPWVRIDKQYRFDTDEGTTTLPDLFKGRSQLLVYHFMFGPEYSAGCPHCSAIADGFNGIFVHLANHDVMLWAVSRAPLPKLQSYKKRLGWNFPWASSGESDFNFDFNVSYTPEQQRAGNTEYNYRKSGLDSRTANVAANDTAPDPAAQASRAQIASTTGTDWPTFTRQAPGMSAFALDPSTGIVYHTYSAFARGLDSLWGVYQWLDRAPLGRNESGFWMRRNDEYANESTGQRK